MKHHLPSHASRCFTKRFMGEAGGGCRGFSLIEILTAVSVLAILMLIVAQLVGSASTLTRLSNRHQQADVRARILFGRMSLDFDRMLKRSDLDYYLKSVTENQVGDDQISFYSETPGYYSPGVSAASVSLVSYRLGSMTEAGAGMERMGKGLSWIADGSGPSAVLYLPEKIADNWPSAAGNGVDSDYEEICPGTLRFEYFYLLKNGTLSAVPWDVASGSTSVSGFKDVAAAVVVVALIDQAPGPRATKEQLETLASQMGDFSPSMGMGELERVWQQVIQSSDLPVAVKAAARLYSRSFPLSR